MTMLNNRTYLTYPAFSILYILYLPTSLPDPDLPTLLATGTDYPYSSITSPVYIYSPPPPPLILEVGSFFPSYLASSEEEGAVAADKQPTRRPFSV